MTTPHCPICGRWNDPTGGKDAHSGGCPNTGKPYPKPFVPTWVGRALAGTLPAKVFA